MKTDRYRNIVLTVIAFLLVWIVMDLSTLRQRADLYYARVLREQSLVVPVRVINLPQVVPVNVVGTGDTSLYSQAMTFNAIPVRLVNP
jgi:hypothetical protein